MHNSYFNVQVDLKDGDPKSAHDITEKTQKVWYLWYQIGVILGVSIGELERILQKGNENNQDDFNVSKPLNTMFYEESENYPL